MKQTICWPYIKPQKDWSGKKQGRLKFILPVYKEIYKGGGLWYYLCKCKCGKEKILYARKGVMSCGCLRTEFNKSRKGKRRRLNKKHKLIIDKPFNCAVDCFVDKSKCIYYDICTNERILKKKMSDRWIEMKGKCYEP